VTQRDRQRLHTRRALADSALRLFAERGYDDTTIDDIAAAAGVTQRTFFHHFPSKAAAAFPDHEQRVADFVARLGDGARQADPVGHLIDTVSQGWKESLGGPAGGPAGWSGASPMRRVRYRLLADVPALRDEDARTDRDYERAIADYLTAAWGDGLDARLRATVVGNTVIGVLRAALVTWGDEEFSVAAVCDELLRRMFAGPLDHPLQSL
jgi:AcrR family transcriptional regulator